MTMMHTATIEDACTAGHSEGKPPDPLYTGPHCSCHIECIDGVPYNVICCHHAMSSIHIPNPHEGASRGGKRL